MNASTLTVPARFNGPPDSGNGGYTCGLLAEALGARPAEAVQPHLDALVAVAAGDPAGGALASLPPSERFHWLVAPSSTVIQPSPVHTGLCLDPAETLERLMAQLVRTP